MRGHSLALACIAAAVAVVVWQFFLQSNPHNAALHARELATRGLAEHLARSKPDERVLVMSNPFTQRKGTDPKIIETEEAGLRGLRQGLGSQGKVGAVVLAELKPGALEDPRSVPINPDTSTPLSYLVAPNAFDNAVQANADCGIVVSLIGLPAELDRCQAWRAAGPPAFALLFPDLRIVGDTSAVIRAMKSGKLLAFVLRKPGGPDDEAKVGHDYQAEFAKRFLLVTAENVEQVAKEHPGLF